MSPPRSPDGKVSSRRSPLLIPLLLLLAIIVFLLLGSIVYVVVFGGGTSLYDEQTKNDTITPHFQSSEISPIIDRPSEIITTTTPSTTIRTSTIRTTASTSPSTTSTVLEEEGSTEDVEESEEDEEEVEEETVQVEVTQEDEDENEVVISNDFTVESVEEETPVVSSDDRERDVAECSILPIDRSSCRHIEPLSAPSPLPIFDLYHYSLNLTTSYSRVFSGSAELYIKPDQPTNLIVLGAGSNTNSFNGISVTNCATGEVICLAHRQDTTSKTVVITLAKETSSILRVKLPKLDSRFPSATISQEPANFNRNLPSVIGTHFNNDNDPSELFPTVLGHGIRAPLSLCLETIEGAGVAASTTLDGAATARARRDAYDRSSRVSRETKRTTCFVKTPALQQKHYAFVVHEKTETLLYNRTSATMPELEVIFTFTERLHLDHATWIHEETERIMSSMSDWTSLPYPLKKITLIDAPIQSSPSVTPIGFVVLKSGSLTGSPKVALMRMSLMRQLIGQWIGGIISSDICIEEALVTYLEWRINDELSFVTSANTTEKVRQTRPASLVSKKRNIGRLRMRPTTASSTCPDRLPAIFYSLDKFYGEGTTRSIIRRILATSQFIHVTLETIADTVSDITGDVAAGSYFRDWFTSSSRPLLRVRKVREGLNVTQVAAPEKELTLWTLPMELDSRLIEIKPEETQILPVSTSPTDCLILDPRRKSTAMIGYDLETYQCLVHCASNARCSLSSSEIDSIFSDLGAFFTANLLKEERGRLSSWTGVLSAAASRPRALIGDARCCASHALRAAPDRECAWTYTDVCEKIELSQAILGH